MIESCSLEQLYPFVSSNFCKLVFPRLESMVLNACDGLGIKELKSLSHLPITKVNMSPFEFDNPAELQQVVDYLSGIKTLNEVKIDIVHSDIKHYQIVLISRLPVKTVKLPTCFLDWKSNEQRQLIEAIVNLPTNPVTIVDYVFHGNRQLKIEDLPIFAPLHRIKLSMRSLPRSSTLKEARQLFKALGRMKNLYEFEINSFNTPLNIANLI